MRILYECDLAGSKYHGMAYRIFQFSEEFRKRGHEVLIIGASYSHVRRVNPVVKKMITNEVIDGIQYKWIKTPSYKRNGIRRVIHMLCYNLTLWFVAKKIAKEFNPDVVIASGVTPFDFIPCNRIAKFSNAKIVFEVGDLWPLTPIELGGYSPNHPFISVMQMAENYAYKHCDKCISLLPCIHEHAEAHGLDLKKLYLVPNGVVLEDWENPDPLNEEHKTFFCKLKSEGKFIVGYTGGHAFSNALDYLLNVAKLITDKSVVFVLVGNGVEKSNLEQRVKDENISNVYFLSPVPKMQIPSLLSLMDILYVGGASSPLYRFGVSPNKVFDYGMSGKPIIWVAKSANDIVTDAKCGISVVEDTIQAKVDAIMQMVQMPIEKRVELGENGRDYVLEHHTYAILSQRFLEAIL